MTVHPSRPPDQVVGSSKLSWRVDALIAIAILLITGPVIERWTAQPASRYVLTAAVVDDRSLQIDRYEGILGVDQARFGGHIYSDKAPYQPLLAVPAYQLFRSLGGQPFPVVDGEQVVNRSTHLGLWWVTIWSATIPAIILTLAVRRLVARSFPSLATVVALAMTLGTTMLPYTNWLFGHTMAAMWVVLAWTLLRPDGPSRRACLAAGVCMGAGIGTEYTVALVALIFLVDLSMRRQWTSAVWLSVGTTVGTVPMLVYNWLVFRDPFEVSYQGHLPNFQGEGALGVYNLTVPQLDELTRALVGDRGLFVLTPVVLLAVVGCCLAIAEQGPTRRDGGIGLLALVGYLAVTTGIDGLGGDAPGPRYLIPMFPLLAIPLAVAWHRFPRPCAIGACFGGATMWMATVTNPNIASTAPGALGTWATDLFDGRLVPNILTGRDHRWILFLTAAAGLAAVVGAVRADPAAGAPTADLDP